ncbi:MAG: GNAT family N-acetyltransferase [Promethearchaeota archaeon]|nr:MAG: GNAT family N-acetyltransferase [Candidatus Lokiarchaeota archaeon]
MSLKQNAHNSKKHASIQDELVKNLTELLHANVSLIFPKAWNTEYYYWFQEIEKDAFRGELRYSFEEVEEKVNAEGVLFLFILINNVPEAFILGNASQIESREVFFLDTIAVKNRGRGIGKMLLKFLINWVKKEKYMGIFLYTEDIDEKNISLRDFYERFGFVLEKQEVDGNLSMILWF